MPTFSEAASAFRNRFRLQEPSDLEPAKATPLFRPASKEVAFQPTAEVPGKDGERSERGASGGSSVQTFELQEDPSFWKDHNVQVVIRIRPLSSSEISLQGYNRCVKQESCQTITWTGHPESRFTFDLVADESVSQEKLFNVAGLAMVENCMEGYNSCMFAYGQTGSGKTHTMLGDIEGGTRRHSVNCGMTPRVFEYLFSSIQKEKETRRDEKLRFTCKVSFLEIYNEQILDLLDPSSVNLQIREDAKKGVYVENLTEFEVSSARDVIQQLVQGAANRKVATTNMNRASSRSHSVFTCVIESKWESQGVTHHRFARLNLVDLAGSERQKSSGAEGERFKEATNINKSLSTLGLVIMNLVSISHGKSLHVPYRDSKLTFLLQDSLGGNSKTTIIANISPSNCCALETLSTLKFAQRAKFIRNNAIVNEDASGDVLAMRMQIQQLKKEVNHLRALVNGGVESQEYDNWSITCPGSPGLFKLDGVHTSSSPLACGRLSQKKGLETALVGALKRAQAKEIELEALAAENQAAVQLAKQREEEIQSLKMRLRFREAAIKRLEAVSLGKISPETHILQENGELLREIAVLRSQVNRNQEVTRFAMENLQLNEEIRQLKSFYEEGERESMSEQIKILENKLLEALDWKLMHENDPRVAQNQDFILETPLQGKDNLFPNEDPSASRDAYLNAEMEFLRVQAIQNEKEIEALRRNLSTCLDSKKHLESRVDELVLQLEDERKSISARNDANKQQPPVGGADSSTVEAPSHNAPNDQMELQIMVNAISAASQREAEAHEMAIVLAKENEELRQQLKILIEETENSHENCSSEAKDTENLEQQLHEMHEENDKLMGLYEKAMQERDEYKRMVVDLQKEGSCQEILAKMDQGENPQSDEALIDSCKEQLLIQEDFHSSILTDNPNFVDSTIFCLGQGKVYEEKIELARTKLDMTDGKLENVVKAISSFVLLEKACTSIEKLSSEIEALDRDVKAKQQEIAVLELQSSEVRGRKIIMDKKLSALKLTLLNFASSVDYWEGREARAKARLGASSHFVTQKKEELALLKANKREKEIALEKVKQSEAEIRSQRDVLRSRLQDLERQNKTEKVLLVIENLDKADVATQRNWQVKAGELLKSEEERSKLLVECKMLQEKPSSLKMEIEALTKRSEELNTEIETVTLDLQKGSYSAEEAEIALKNVIREKEVLLEMRETGMTEIGNIIVEYQNATFQLELKAAEIKVFDEELLEGVRRLEELKAAAMAESQKRNQVLEDNRVYFNDEVEEELREVHRSIMEVKSVLVTETGELF